MRATLCLLSLAATAALAAPAQAGDRYGPANPYQPSRVVTDYTGPLLGWGAKAAAPPALAPTAAAPVQAVRPVAPTPWVRPASLPTSLYDPPASAPAAQAQPASSPYVRSQPTGQPIQLATTSLTPTPSLERQQAAEEEAAVLAARIARADALAAQGVKPQTNTDLLGGP